MSLRQPGMDKETLSRNNPKANTHKNQITRKSVNSEIIKSLYMHYFGISINAIIENLPGICK